MGPDRVFLVSHAAPRYNLCMRSMRSKIRRLAGKKAARKRASPKRSRREAIWEEIRTIAQAIPKADLHKIPTDLSANHDHYLYGHSPA